MTARVPAMIPIGYMLKRVAESPPDWLEAPGVARVCSLSRCVSEPFGDYINLWKHNGWWLFDSPAAVRAAAAELGAELESLTLFYYEAFDRAFDEDSREWRPIAPEESFGTDVAPCINGVLRGFDVTCFWLGTAPECSPLSCNHLAGPLKANVHCLFDTFEAAHDALEAGLFDDSEPGPFRIVAVYEVGEG